jgi:hypothetical protein
VQVIAVELERGAPMELTANHRVFSATRNGWVAAGELREGEALQAREGTVRVRAVRGSERGLTSVFNLEVYARHEFFVGEELVRAHNSYNFRAVRPPPYAVQTANMVRAQNYLARRQIAAVLQPGIRGGPQLPAVATVASARRILEAARAGGARTAYVRLQGYGSLPGQAEQVAAAYQTAAQALGIDVRYGRAAQRFRDNFGEVIRINLSGF